VRAWVRRRSPAPPAEGIEQRLEFADIGPPTIATLKPSRNSLAWPAPPTSSFSTPLRNLFESCHHRTAHRGAAGLPRNPVRASSSAKLVQEVVGAGRSMRRCMIPFQSASPAGRPAAAGRDQFTDRLGAGRSRRPCRKAALAELARPRPARTGRQHQLQHPSTRSIRLARVTDPVFAAEAAGGLHHSSRASSTPVSPWLASQMWP